MGAGIVGWEIVNSNSLTDSNDKTLTVTCQGANNSILGGGYQVTTVSNSDRQKVSVVQNYPSGGTQWTVQALEAQPISNNWTLIAYAVCGVA
jgi:hypothetical protein